MCSSDLADIRVDTGVERGDAVTAFYDPMIAKIIAHGATREAALNALARSLGDTIVAGPRCNVAFLRALAEAKDFRAGRFDTGFIGRNLATLTAGERAADHAAVALAAATLVAKQRNRIMDEDFDRRGPRSFDDPWEVGDGFQFVGERKSIAHVIADDARFSVEIAWRGEAPVATLAGVCAIARLEPPFWRCDDHELVAVDADDAILVLRNGRQMTARLAETMRDAIGGAQTNGGAIRSPMHGKLVSVAVAAGDRVHKGQKLAIVEAMKMEHALVAPFDGRVAQVSAKAGAQVAQGASIEIGRAHV